MRKLRRIGVLGQIRKEAKWCPTHIHYLNTWLLFCLNSLLISWIFKIRFYTHIELILCRKELIGHKKDSLEQSNISGRKLQRSHLHLFYKTKK